MAHKTRAARKANLERRERAAHKQRPVPVETQREVAAQRQAEHAARYPEPPVYSDSYNRKPSRQPACYDANLEVLGAIAPLLVRAYARMRRHK